MVRNYEIGSISMDTEASFMRNVELKTERTKLNSFARAVTKDLSERFIRNVYSPTFNDNGVLEVFIKLNLRNIRDMDHNPQVHEIFWKRNFPENLMNSGLLRVIVLMLYIGPNDTISNDDVSYINDILMWEANDLFITPILKFSDDIEPDKKVSIYEDFTKRLLAEKNNASNKSGLRVGISIPFFYPRRKVEDIFKLYNNENKTPQFILIDFERARLTSSSMIGKIQRINTHFKNEEEEKYFVYAFNMKPHKKGVPNPLAEDVGAFLGGLNAIGRTYTTSPIPRPVFIKYVKEWQDLQKTFGNDDYKYHLLNEDKYRKTFAEWSNEKLGTSIEVTNAKPSQYYYTYIKRYNVNQLNTEATELTKYVIESDIKEIKKKTDGKEILQFLPKIQGKI